MSTMVHMCDQCKHFICNSGKFTPQAPPCTIGHNPKFYMPRNNDPYDPRWGYKRKCDDFESIEVV